MLRGLQRAGLPARYQRPINWAFGIAGGLLGLVFIIIYVLLRPERFTTFLQARARSAGLDLELAYPASPSLWPHPAIRLQGLTLSEPGAEQPILVADRGRVELPWIALLQRHTAIEWLQLDSPRVDVDALQDWLRELPADTFTHSPSLPRIDAGISVFNGSLVDHGQQVWLDDLNITAGALRPGQPFHLDLTGSQADSRPFSLSLDMLPDLAAQQVRLKQLQLHLDYGQLVHTQLHGRLDWLGGAQLQLALSGQARRDGYPAADISIEMRPATTADQLQLGFHYTGADGHAELQLPPDQWLQWWSLLHNNTMSPALKLPQWQGHVRVEQVDLAGAHVEGLEIDADPASSGSTAAPARTTTPTP